MKSIFMFGVSSLLFLSACNMNEDTLPPKVEALDESQIAAENSKNVEGVTIGYEYNWNKIERDLFSLDSQLSDEDYKNIGIFFNSFSLPEEGRLSLEEAKEYFPQDLNYGFSDNEIYYKNYLAFDKNTSMALSTNIWSYDPNTYDPIEPFGSQAVGLFMSTVKDINNNGYLSPNGELVDQYTDLSIQEIEYLENESFYSSNQKDSTLPKGWNAFQSIINGIQLKLEYIEPYLKEYQELYIWSAETRQYLQVADAIGYHDYEKAYDYIVAATNNIERMYMVLPES